jgi:prepilin-type N-terminal cleavage/methylation domain-containing protein
MIMKNFTHTNYKIPRPSIKTRGTPFFKGGFKRGFTIIETLVAIAILMIAIAGPLVVATKGLTSALVAKDQMIASYLAQESMEVIKNIRDNNLATPPTYWLAGIVKNDGSGQCMTGLVCDVGPFNTEYEKCTGNSPCKISYNSLTGYNNQGSGQPTIFSRSYYIEELNPQSSTEKRVHVIVDWKEGTVPYQVEVTSELVDITR